MYEDGLFCGRSSLGDKTLCLTFDDGPGRTGIPQPAPGPRTVEIARYLNKLGIRATFFVVGKFACELPDVMREVQDLGHLIGNHTYDHFDLVDYASGNGDVVSQISRTDSLIRSYVDGPVIFFRPPYGKWDSAIARILNADSEVSVNHVGPIAWDIDCRDWECWQEGKSPDQCANSSMSLIEKAGRRGIVLMHDCTADIEEVKLANRTFELIQHLIPRLLDHGYRFVRLDEVPGIVTAAGVSHGGGRDRHRE